MAKIEITRTKVSQRDLAHICTLVTSQLTKLSRSYRKGELDACPRLASQWKEPRFLEYERASGGISRPITDLAGNGFQPELQATRRL